MKKDKKQLKLSSETIRTLTETQLHAAAGGGETASNNSCDRLHGTCKRY